MITGEAGPSSATRTAAISTTRALPYSLDDLYKSLEKVQEIRYKETCYPFKHTRITPYSSGYALGSANWIVEHQHQRLSLVSNSSLWAATHPSNLDYTVIDDTDTLFLGGPYTASAAIRGGGPPTPLSQVFNQITSVALATLKRKGNVLFPGPIMGPVFDLLEVLAYALDAQNMGKIHFYAVSPVADRSLLYANIMGEWMCPEKQNLIYLPESPLVQDELISSGRLTYCASLDQLTSISFQEPCIIFAGHDPTWSRGPAVELLVQWGEHDRHTVILTDPMDHHHHTAWSASLDAPSSSSVSAGVPASSVGPWSVVFRAWEKLRARKQVVSAAPKCTIHTIPLEMNLSPPDVHHLIQRTAASTVILPSVIYNELPNGVTEAGQGGKRFVSYAFPETISWQPGVPQRQMVHLSEDTAKNATVHQIDGKTIVRVRGLLRSERDGLWIQSYLKVRKSIPKAKPLLCGSWVADRLTQAIEINPTLELVSLEHKGADKVVITVTGTSAQATIICDKDRTKIQCDSDGLRKQITDLLFSDDYDLDETTAEIICKPSTIAWKAGKDLSKPSDGEDSSFFHWFASNESSIGELLATDLFPNAVRYFQDEVEDDDEEAGHSGEEELLSEDDEDDDEDDDDEDADQEHEAAPLKKRVKSE
ncbi:Integrator complex subunit 9 [Dimargaris cristalligena]|nr:Integrator complex subunit 9 [Dimargaris cristalligena]